MSRVPVLLVAGPPGGTPQGWVALRPTACPCCVGRVALQVELARLIRDKRPNGVVIELADPAHLPTMRRALGEWPLSEALELADRSRA